MELLSLHSQLHELETRRSHVVAAGGPEETLLQLVMEISAVQQQVSFSTHLIPWPLQLLWSLPVSMALYNMYHAQTHTHTHTLSLSLD